MQKGYGAARAYTNIALVKYWGKRDERYIIPYNPSISLTLDAWYSDTVVRLGEVERDMVSLDGNPAGEKASARVLKMVEEFRLATGNREAVEVSSINHVPTASGLASSASGLCALAGALNEAYGRELSRKDLSRVARRGSGSACRSVYGGFAMWQAGDNDETSYAVDLGADDFASELAILGIVMDVPPKKVPSRAGMQRCVETSSYYSQWVEEATRDAQRLLEAITAHDFTALGEISEANSLKMHATTITSVPPWSYWNGDSMRAMNAVRELHEQGLECYSTMDAGPHVMVICRARDIADIREQMCSTYGFRESQCVAAYAGPGVTKLTKV